MTIDDVWRPLGQRQRRAPLTSAARKTALGAGTHLPGSRHQARDQAGVRRSAAYDSRAHGCARACMKTITAIAAAVPPGVRVNFGTEFTAIIIHRKMSCSSYLIFMLLNPNVHALYHSRLVTTMMLLV
jgi:hypothetical protein